MSASPHSHCASPTHEHSRLVEFRGAAGRGEQGRGAPSVAQDCWRPVAPGGCTGAGVGRQGPSPSNPPFNVASVLPPPLAFPVETAGFPL